MSDSEAESSDDDGDDEDEDGGDDYDGGGGGGGAQGDGDRPAEPEAKPPAGRKKPRAVIVSQSETEAGDIEIRVRVGLERPKLLMLEIAERAATATRVQHIPGIKKCYIIGGPGTGKPLQVQADGVNFPAVRALDRYIDVDRVTSNDVFAVLDTYGVEAARATIVAEVNNVFDTHNIKVDVRHLSLISDHMTFQGAYRPFNRGGISSSTSPRGTMSFETAVSFLVSATLRGEADALSSPSAKIIMGQNVELGTGAFSIHVGMTGGPGP